MSPHVMIDLETMGRRPGAAIIAIGAVRFDVAGFDRATDCFYRAIDLEDAVSMGLRMDAGTVRWWLRQSAEARATLEDPERVTLAGALMDFSQWIGGDAGNVQVWGNGAAFDNGLLGCAYEVCGLLQPWKFWNDRCYRTIKARHPDVPFQRSGVHHNALADAVSQAEHLLAIWRKEAAL